MFQSQKYFLPKFSILFLQKKLYQQTKKLIINIALNKIQDFKIQEIEFFVRDMSLTIELCTFESYESFNDITNILSFMMDKDQ